MMANAILFLLLLTNAQPSNDIGDVQLPAGTATEDTADGIVIQLIEDCEFAAGEEIRSSRQDDEDTRLVVQELTDRACVAANTALRPYRSGSHMFTFRENTFSNAELANRLDAVTSRIQQIREDAAEAAGTSEE